MASVNTLKKNRFLKTRCEKKKMTCCFDCKYCKVDPEMDERDPDPWICTLTGEQTDPESQCAHFVDGDF